MARKTKLSLRQSEPQYHCSDCSHSYDWHSRSLDGHLILCRCPFRMEGGKWCIFLSDPACNLFSKRKPDDRQQQKI